MTASNQDQPFDVKHRSRILLEGPRSRACALDVEGDRLHRRGSRASRSSASPTPGSRRCPATTTCAGWRRRSRRASARPAARRWSSTPSRSATAITMGTEGMKALARQPRGDRRLRSSWSGRGHCSTRSSRSSACDKTIPGARHGACPRSTCPASSSTAARFAPGHYKGRDLTVLDVFEAVGANAAGKMSEQELQGDRGRRLPRRRAPAAASTPPTRWPWRWSSSACRPWASAACPRPTPRKDEVGSDAGELVMDVLRRGLRPRDILTRAGVRKRHRRRRRDGRIDQRRPAPAGAWPAKRTCRSRSTTSTRSARARRSSPT